MFHYKKTSTDALLGALLKKYKEHNQPISVNFRSLVSELKSADRATHLLHPYPAKLLMHIPFFFLANSNFSRPGDPVLDPFCGSGTVLLEAQLAGRPALGADSNPFALLLSKAKTTALPLNDLHADVTRLLSRISKSPRGTRPDVVNLDHWFYPHVIRQLVCIADAIATTKDGATADFFKICFSNCVRKVSLADPRLAVPVRLRPDQYPPNHVLRDKTEAHIRRLRRINVTEIFADVVENNCRRMATLDAVRLSLPTAELISTNARKLSCEHGSIGQYGRHIADGSIQLIITSPPYPGAQKYIRSCSLSLGWLGLCPSDQLRAYKALAIGREEYTKAESIRAPETGLPEVDRKLSRIRARSPIRATIAGVYLNEMRSSLEEMHRVLRPGGHLVLVAANNSICGELFKTQEYLRRIAEGIGFSVILRLVDTIRSRGLMTKRNRTAGVITREWVHVFQKRA